MVSIFIDTIEGYGKSKETLGDLLKDYREDIVIATKVGGNYFDYNILEKRLLGSLERLKTDFVNLCQIH